MNNALRLVCIGLAVFASQILGAAQACIVSVDDFSRMDGAVFLDLAGSPTGAIGGGVTVTGSPPMVGWLGLGASANPSGADPGDGHGWAAGSIVRHRFGDVPVVLDFDIPIAGFGVTFMHFYSPTFQPFNDFRKSIFFHFAHKSQRDVQIVNMAETRGIQPFLGQW